jgi:NADH-quinone oxidoreductase subunit L
MNEKILLLPILIPLVAGIVALFVPRRSRGVAEGIALCATAACVFLAMGLFKNNIVLSLPWAGFGFEFLLRLYHFSAFMLAGIAGFGFLVVLYSVLFMRDKDSRNQYYAYFLMTLAFSAGAVLADNLLLLLFFWEGLLGALYGMITIGHKDAFKTATKAFIIVGITDLCMMVGIALTGHLAGTMTLSQISLPLTGLGVLAFILLMIGAISKAGAMPFHSWIPDAAVDAPLPFMALVPAALEKLLGIYFLARISLDLFLLHPDSGVSMLLMVIGAVTILLAVMMALIQKDYKRLLSYHAISQVGYMILGIGTAVPVGIVGGLFHMINHALYKSCLFLTGGSVEKQAGTTDLAKLGGIGRAMPVTFVCFIITACAISGVPPLNGFFSKELVYDGALERGWIFYAAALLGSFFTAASFLKLGHAAFLGKASDANRKVKEAPWAMLVPMITIASLCVFFGIFNALPLNNLIQPILGEHRLEGHHFAGWPHNTFLVVMTVVVIAGAVLNHWFGVKAKGSGLKAVDHIHYAPVLSGIYDKAEKRFFDPYDIGLKLVDVLARALNWLDRAVDWIYEALTVRLVLGFAESIKGLHNGNYSRYLAWSMVGMLLVVVYLMSAF